MCSMAKDAPTCPPPISLNMCSGKLSKLLKSLRLRSLYTVPAITRKGKVLNNLKDSFSVKKQWLQTSQEYVSVGNRIDILTIKEMELWDSILIGRWGNAQQL